MLPRRVTISLLSFLVLTAGVATNVFLMHTRGARETAGVTRAEACNCPATVAADFDTGSTGAPVNAKTPDGVTPKATAAPRAPATPAGPAEITKAVQRELEIRGYETGAHDGVVGV